jgi:protease-4
MNIASKLRRQTIVAQNAIRQSKRLPKYVLWDWSGEIKEFAPQLPRIPFAERLPIAHALNVSEIRRTFEQLAYDSRIEGVIIKLNCATNAATYQTLRTLIRDYREQGKKAIAYATQFTPFQYYLACACDQIIMPPSAEWMVLGLGNEYVFLKDALAQIGVEFDVVNVSPFKSAGDQLARNDFSAESRAQAEWLLDAMFDELVNGIAAGRKMSVERVKPLINAAPLSARSAMTEGLLDATLYEDELERYLTGAPVYAPQNPFEKYLRAQIKKQQGANENEPEPEAQIKPLNEVRDLLTVKPQEFEQKLIGIVQIEGAIVDGRSQSLPVPLPIFGNQAAGNETIAQAIRAAERDDRIAAVILHVKSPGGSALASDLIAREVRRLRRKKPVVAFMTGVAASGGYYVAALADKIIAQPLTITGSIGVVMTKPNLQNLSDRLRIHRTTLKRGEHFDFISPTQPLEGESRELAESLIARTYNEFKDIVAEGRDIPRDELEPLCGGRVWTGQMARERKLVDYYGDFRVALQTAVELASIPTTYKRVGAIVVHPPKDVLLPKPVEVRGTLTKLLTRTRVWALLPWSIEQKF